MTDIEQRVADETAARMRVHNLKQARLRLSTIRTDLKMVREFVEDDEQFAGDITATINNSIQPLMWKIETAIREGAK